MNLHPQFADRELRGQLGVQGFVHPLRSGRLGPAHHVVLHSQTTAPPEVVLPPLMHPERPLHAALQKRGDPEKRGEIPVPEDQIARAEAVPQRAEQRGLARRFSLIRAQRPLAHRPGGQRDHRNQPGQGESQAGLLRAGLGKGLLVGDGVGHGHRGTVIDVNATAFPQPLRVCVVIQGAVGELAAQGNPTLLVEVDNATAARAVLGNEPRITHVEEEGASKLRLTLGDGLGAAEINRALVTAGVAVSRLEPARATLEEMFLSITSRLGENE